MQRTQELMKFFYPDNLPQVLSFVFGWQHIGKHRIMCSEGDVADGCATAWL